MSRGAEQVTLLKLPRSSSMPADRNDSSAGTFNPHIKTRLQEPLFNSK
jgi:hypothetical protein